MVNNFDEQPPLVTVAAVVVTYNRKQLLVHCLEAVLAQTRPVEHIFIVDNASTDGTPDFLRAQGYLDRPGVELIRLPRNAGGAGGFHAGTQRAVATGSTWLWLMDDDGRPELTCLEKLLEHADRYDVLGPAIVDPDEPSVLNWIGRVTGPSGKLTGGGYVRTREQLERHARDGVFEGDAGFFNGVIFRRRAFEAVGAINAALFIRGDETDYYYRCRIAGLRIGTVVHSLLFHPRDALAFNELKYYYAFRNRVYLHRKYSHLLYGSVVSQFGLAYIVLRYLTLSPRRSWPYMRQVFAAVWAALNGKLIPYAPSQA